MGHEVLLFNTGINHNSTTPDPYCYTGTYVREIKILQFNYIFIRIIMGSLEAIFKYENSFFLKREISSHLSSL